MWVGDVVADRFVIEHPIGSGGMGSVFRAADRLGGEPVALKVLDLVTDGAAERFRREARLLSDLSHPGIVRYVAHGETAEGRSFLVMELLEGEDLAERLSRKALTVEESLVLIRRATEALTVAHAQGIVHRDLKPSNLFLVESDVQRVKVLDFGIARGAGGTRGLTQTGAMLGTVGYMAPEQAMGSRDVDARADVFALGCVLFECLTGRPAFEGEHAVAILAKVLTEEAPRVTELRPEVGEALATLVAAMLAKNRDERPESAARLRDLFDTLGASPAEKRDRSSLSPASLTRSEQRVVSVILAEPSGGAAVAETSTPDAADSELGRAQEIARQFDAELTAVQGGSLLFVHSGKGAATDQAARAAACALAVRRAFPDLRIALATGRAETGERLPIGPAIDRVAALLRAETPAPRAGILLDDLSAGLLGGRFVVQRDGSGPLLVGEAVGLDARRTLLGKPTPTVGREKELGLLEATLAECTDDSVARLVLVTAPPGVGKSRLATEFLARARRDGKARVLLARSEAVGGSSALAIVRSLIRRAARLRDGEPLPVQQVRFFEYLQALWPDEEAQRAAEFVGEAIGVPTPHPPSHRLLAARNDPRLLGERVRQAIPAWFDAECARGPLVLIVEDLHWADPESVAQIEAALGRLADSPLLIVALGRPEGRDVFPKLWGRSGAQDVRLDGLTRRAAERLVRSVLGESARPDIVSRIVERAEGNAFYLEELIRSAAEGSEGLPETVTAMAASRLERLEPEARRVLRAASVFGEVCWEGGVSALLGGDAGAGAWLEALAEREVLSRVADSRFAGQREYTFRHALLRDSAYGMLTESDRKAGHVLAGEWLGRIDGAEPLAVADHFERAEDLANAVPWLVTAMFESVGRASPRRSIELGDRALAAGATGMNRGLVRAQQAGRALSLGDARLMVEAGRDAIRLLPATHPAWFLAAGSIMVAAWSDESAVVGAEILSSVMALEAMPAATGPLGFALLALVVGALMFGQSVLGRRILGRMDEAAAAVGASAALGPDFCGYRVMACHWVASWADDDVARGLAMARESSRQLALSESSWSIPLVPYYAGFGLYEVGHFSEAATEFEQASELNRAIGADYTVASARLMRSVALADSGALDGPELLRPHLDATDASRRGSARISLAAFFLHRAHDADAAERCLPSLSEVDATMPIFHQVMHALHAQVLLARGAVGEALALAERAATGHKESPMSPTHRSIVLLSHAECLRAAGREMEANGAIRTARDRLLRHAGGFDDGATRHAYLTNHEPNRRTIALAREWLGEEA